MKDFLKMTGAVIVGVLIVGFVSTVFSFALLGSLMALGKSTPVMPQSAVLTIDMGKVSLGEQTKEMNPMTAVKGTGQNTIGILDATRAIEAAAEDPAVQYIYLKPDMAVGGMAEIEELRAALERFRTSGKPVISYIENPSNAGYYLASVSDKIYMTPHAGGMNMLTGISSQMIFLKDILDKLGVNVQLIRHGKYKSAGEMFIRSNSSEENMKQNQEMISAIWNSWCEEIAAGRDISTEKFNGIIDNLELNLPVDYLNNGLVDELLTLDELNEKLGSFSASGTFDKASMISISDYASLKVTPNYKADNTVAVIYASGNIVEGEDNNQVAGDRFAKIIQAVRKDDSIKSVVFRVNSPGGSVLAAEKIRDEITLLAAQKPVIASFGDYAASGGYWVSAGCDHIFTNSSTLTGSIGVFSIIPDFSKTLDNIAHINVTSVNSNRHSDIYSCMRPLNDKEVGYMQASVEHIYNRFTTVVSEGRDMTVEYVDSIGQGRVWAGSDALKIGLADTKGTIMDAVRFAAQMGGEAPADMSQWQIVEYPKPLTAIETILQTLGTSSVSIFEDTPLSNVEAAFRNWSADDSGKCYARIPYEITIR